MIDKLNIYFIFAFAFAFVFALIIFYFGIYFYKNLFSIEELKSDKIDIMEQIENKYGKKYPMGDDYFRIIHYPQYKSFFEQFSNYKYLVKKNQNQIVSTCCFTNLYKDIYYICDLKKIGSNSNQTFDFIAYGYIVLGIRKMFGIVMEPNPIINHLTNKYGFVKLNQLNLYKIKFSIIKKNKDFFDKIFPNFFIVPGYKKFILESNKTELKCYHIAQPTDINLIPQLQKPISFNDIMDQDDIMFCIDSNSNSNLNYLLELKNIFHTNKMSIIANKQINKKFNFDLLKTYMI